MGDFTICLFLTRAEEAGLTEIFRQHVLNDDCQPRPNDRASDLLAPTFPNRPDRLVS